MGYNYWIYYKLTKFLPYCEDWDEYQEILRELNILRKDMKKY